MVHAGGMDSTQRRKDRHKQLPGIIPTERAAAALHKIPKRDGLHPFRHCIRRIVLFKNIIELGDGRKLPHMGHLSGTAEKV